MPLIQLSHIKKSFSLEDLLTDISFSVEKGEKIGLVGRNGCGKSTLFSILKEETEADGGQYFKQSGLTTAYLKQEPVIHDHLDGFFDMAMYYAGCLLLDTDLFNQAHLSGKETLSGGERTKIALACLLAQEPELLLLDEPTNHMDIESTRVLTNLINEYSGAVLIVSHDRYFLDRTVDRILEIENGVITGYTGNYSAYRFEKEKRLQDQQHRYESAKKEEKRIEDAIKKTREWAEKSHRDSTKVPSGTPKMGYKEKARTRAKKLDKHAKNAIKHLEKHKNRSEEKPRYESKVHFAISAEVSSGKRILDIQNLSFSFGNHPLISDSSFFLNRGEHLAVFGANGCGKSTLIDLICGNQQPDSGDIWISPSRKPYTIEQHIHLYKNPDQTALSYLINELGNVGGKERALLHHLGITTRHLQTPLEKLSFGEQMKIRLSSPILQEKEFLILDEPTHYLDLPTREALEKTLSEYEGTLLLVSHDIYFLKQVCDKVLISENGKFRRLEKSFQEYADENF